MLVKTVTVGIAEDAIEQITKVSLDRAVEELIWNALDVEATKVKVVFHVNALEAIEKVVVLDNGHGIPYGQVPVGQFCQAGARWARLERQAVRL